MQYGRPDPAAPRPAAACSAARRARCLPSRRGSKRARSRASPSRPASRRAAGAGRCGRMRRRPGLARREHRLAVIARPGPRARRGRGIPAAGLAPLAAAHSRPVPVRLRYAAAVHWPPRYPGPGPLERAVSGSCAQHLPHSFLSPRAGRQPRLDSRRLPGSTSSSPSSPAVPSSEPDRLAAPRWLARAARPGRSSWLPCRKERPRECTSHHSAGTHTHGQTGRSADEGSALPTAAAAGRQQRWLRGGTAAQ